MDSFNRLHRYLRRQSIFTPFRNRYRWTLAVLVLFCFTLIVITKLAKSDTTITIAHFDTKIYNQQIIDSEDLIASNPKGILDSEAHHKSLHRSVTFSYTQSDGFTNTHFDCEKIKAINVKYVIASGFNSIMYATQADMSGGTGWLSIRIVSKKSPDVSACLSQFKSKDIKIDCSVISDQILTHEAELLNKFHHPNIAPVLNVCKRVDVSNPDTLSRVGSKLMVLEDARPLDMSAVLKLEWKDRVKKCIDIGGSLKGFFRNRFDVSKINKTLVKLVLASTSASIAETLTFPLDLTKTRLQIQGETSGLRTVAKKRGMFQMAWGVIREEGVFKLWRGVTPAVIRHIFYTGLRVTIYENLREHVFKRNSKGQFPLYKSIIASICSGMTAQFVASPMDLIKVRFQMDGRRQLQGLKPMYRGVSHALTTIVREEGVLRLWRGVVPNCQRAGFVALGDLAAYDLAKRSILQYTTFKDDIITHILSSAVAGLTATTLGTPADVIKTRVMNQPTKNGKGIYYKSSIDCLIKSVKSEGIFSLYKGFFPIYARLASIVDLLYTNNSIQLVPFEPSQFYISSADDVVKLVDVGGLFNGEPTCSSNEDCYVTNTVVTDCVDGQCKDFSWKANSINAHRWVAISMNFR
ncbi:hypothetical protein LOD99_2905 [Oopsacas minuta]|uniref:Uncharacterized protein n=1 Tax=Oopsacas minuta TaxID=111878 RepID=A0AAV7JYM4_9METZ|nr:hypothetical protein LOD99_2905 [Oopsacas minuta]